MTFLAIAMALGAGVALGVPLVWLARGRKPLEAHPWPVTESSGRERGR